jgi:nucleoid-associated protein YgaU
MAAAETPMAGAAAGAASEGAAAAGEQQVAMAEAPKAGEAVGGASEGATAAGEGQMAAAAPSVEGEATAGAAEAAKPETEVAMAAPVERIEIGPVEASGQSASSDAVSAEASSEVIALSGLAVAAVEGEARGLAVTVEAAPGAIDASEVTIRAAEAEAGTLYVAGVAPPGTLVRVYANEAFVGEARAGQDGTWLIEAKRDVPVGEIVFRVEAAPEADASESRIVEAAVPFMRYADGVVLEPVVDAASGGGEALVSEASAPRPTYVIIRRGDNLWRIARRNYGRGIKYQAIFAANRDSIRNPHWIYPGQVFIIPTRDRTWAEAAIN